MDKEEVKKKLLDERNGEEEDISVVTAVSLPKKMAYSKTRHREIGFWPLTIEKCKKLELNQAIKVKLLQGENPTNFGATARSVAKQHGFYLNTVFKYPYMFLWPDKMRGRVLPEDWNSRGAVFFEEVKEVKDED